MQPSVWIVILNWENSAETLACLQTFENVTWAQKHVLVVDNGSKDNSRELLSAYHPSYEYIFTGNKENLGYAGGNNTGIQYALAHGAEYICVLNNDTRVDARFLDKLMGDAQHHKEAGIWGGLIYENFSVSALDGGADNNAVWFAGGQLEWHDIARIGKHVFAPSNTEGYSTQFVTGCCLMARREVWEQTGGFDERFFLYFEDIDLNLRAQKLGWACRVVPQAVIWHNVSSTSISKLGSPGMLYYHHRNGLLLASLHGLWWVKIYMHVWAAGKVVKNSFKILVGKERDAAQKIIDGISAYYCRRFGKLS